MNSQASSRYTASRFDMKLASELATQLDMLATRAIFFLNIGGCRIVSCGVLGAGVPKTCGSYCTKPLEKETAPAIRLERGRAFWNFIYSKPCFKSFWRGCGRNFFQKVSPKKTQTPKKNLPRKPKTPKKTKNPNKKPPRLLGAEKVYFFLNSRGSGLQLHGLWCVTDAWCVKIKS